MNIKLQDLPAKDFHLKPPFKANSKETVNCPLPLVKRYNPIRIDNYCHGWLFKDELCHHAAYCSSYLALIIQRMNTGKQLDLNTLARMGIGI